MDGRTKFVEGKGFGGTAFVIDSTKVGFQSKTSEGNSSGEIDRISGDITAYRHRVGDANEQWKLKCHPAKRTF